MTTPGPLSRPVTFSDLVRIGRVSPPNPIGIFRYRLGLISEWATGRPSVSQDAESFARYLSDVIEGVDEAEFDLDNAEAQRRYDIAVHNAPQPVGQPPPYQPRIRPYSFFVTVVCAAKIEFNLRGHTEADRLVVRRFIKDKMVLHGMRVAHIAKQLDLAVEAAFAVTRDELFAIEYASTRHVVDRYDARDNKYWTFFGWTVWRTSRARAYARA